MIKTTTDDNKVVTALILALQACLTQMKKSDK